MDKTSIYHICTEISWEEQINSDEYIHASLEDEGFIHCSEKHQVEGVLERYFSGQKDLFILTIDSTKVNPKIQFDKAPNEEYFPHIYGALNKSAIVKIDKIDN